MNFFDYLTQIHKNTPQGQEYSVTYCMQVWAIHTTTPAPAGARQSRNILCCHGVKASSCHVGALAYWEA